MRRQIKFAGRLREVKNKVSKVLCTECGQILESVDRHDFVICKCPNQTSVDGGSDYTKCGGADLSKVYIWIPQKQVFKCCVNDQEIGFGVPPKPEE